MKICWDNIKDLYISKRGNLRIGTRTFFELPSCIVCGEPYLARKINGILEKFCCHGCYSKFKIGKLHTEATKVKISKSNKGRVGPMLGKKHSIISLNKISKAQHGENHNNYKGGVTKLNLPLFDTYNEKINYAEATKYVYRNELKLLQIRCSKCRKWFTPTTREVARRKLSLEGKKGGECRFYCSDICKTSCEVFNTKLYPRNNKYKDKYGYNLWRLEVLMRANYECEYCGERAVYAHHIRPQKLEPFFALDPDYGLACCEKCHYNRGHVDECSTGSLASIICGEGN